MSIFITSDTHFCHSKILIYCNRPWLREGDLKLDEESNRWEYVNSEIARLRTEEMDEALIKNWNRKVSPKDTVYHLGDVCFSRNKNKVHEVLNRLNGKICLIRGNHDTEVLKLYPERFEWVRMIHTVKHQKKRIVCCHYAMKTWDQSHRGAYQLYGHTHGNLKEDPNLLSFDVGMDANNFQVLSIDEVIQRMEKKGEKAVIDNHRKYGEKKS